MKEVYIKYYTPLAQGFCEALREGDHPGLEHMPQPFLPLFGKGYERAALRLLIIGQDTKGWGNTAGFVQGVRKDPGKYLEEMFREIESQEFRTYGKRTHSFFGFAMALLASLHGLPNWNVLKCGGHEDILSSFAWGNANAVELWGSLTKHTSNVPRSTWEAVRAAGEHLNRFSHMLETLRPQVVLLTVKSIDREGFFQGYNLLPMEVVS